MPRRLSWALVANTAVTAAVLLNGFPSIASADTAAKAVRGNQAASPSWTGSWNTVDAAGNKILMKLSQKGSTATGTYSLCHGSIHATIVGKILKGTWSQSNQRPCGGSGEPPNGTIQFTISANNRSFTGFYSWTGSSTAKEPWNGERAQS